MNSAAGADFANAADAAVHPGAAALLACEQHAQRTPAWYEARRGKLTASDVAGVLGLRPYASYRGDPRADTMKRKLENLPLDNVPAVAHGVRFEPEACRALEAALGESIADVGLVAHPRHPWLAASPDGVCLRSGALVEIKCPMRRAIEPGRVPDHYWPQVQVQLAVAGLRVALFAQYRPGTVDGRRFTDDGRPFLDVAAVEFDAAWFERVLPALKGFHEEYVVRAATFVPPPPPPPIRCLVVPGLYAPAGRG